MKCFWWGNWTTQCLFDQAILFCLVLRQVSCDWHVKSTWIKVVEVGNYTGWPLINEHNVGEYYPKIMETSNGHMDQTRGGNLGPRSQPPIHLKSPNGAMLQSKKVCDIYTKVCDVRKTILLDKIGQFPTKY